MKRSPYFILAMFAAVAAGCATTAPSELVNARSAYQRASMGPAQQLAPAELHKARTALDQAEQSFKEDSDSYKTKDLAYIAQRKSEKAEALGVLAADTSTKEQANAAFLEKQSAIVKQTKQDLADSEMRAADARAEIEKQAALKAARDKANADLERQQAIIAQGKKDLSDSEKQTAAIQAEFDKQAAVKAAKDRADADLQSQQAIIMQREQELRESEKRTDAALAELASLASLKEEERGLVITLSGNVLFRSAESALLPSAQQKLDQMAKALLAIPARKLIVEGHTDSQGSVSYNQDLSQRRGDAVRDYLVQRGYPADHIQSQGRGEGSPIANNASPEGRANNRRVEIVIEREAQAPR